MKHKSRPAIIPQSKSALLLILLLGLSLISLTLLELIKPQIPRKKATITPETTLSTATLLKEGLITQPYQQVQIDITLNPTTNQYALQNALRLTTQAGPQALPDSPYTLTLHHQETDTTLQKPIKLHTPHYEPLEQLINPHASPAPTTSPPDFPSYLSLTTAWPHPSAQLTLKKNGQIVFTSTINRFSLPSSSPTTTNSFLAQESLQADIAPQNYFHLVIISDQYTASEITQFHRDVERFLNDGLLQIDPFPQFVHRLQFHIIDNPDNDLGCGFYSQHISRLLTCNPHQVRTIVNLAQVPWDKIAVIVNEEKFGGSATGIGGDIAISSRNSYLPRLLTHELGHTLGLHDEYTTGRYLIPHRNCAPQTPYPAWFNLTNPASYHPGCTTPDTYRSTSTSLMNNLNAPFNPISQAILARALNHQSPNLPNPDINQDQHVNQQDLAIITQHFNQSNSTFPSGDATHDGTINLADFNLVVSSFNH